MHRYLIGLALAALVAVPGHLLAQSCADWSQSIDQPTVHPGITGQVCSVVGTTCYIAGSDFQLVDLSDVADPAVLGSLLLPADAVQILPRGDSVFLLLAGYGLVEIDLTVPSIPVLARTFPSTQLTCLADMDPYIVAADAASQLHVLDVQSGPSISELSVQAAPITPEKMGRVGSFLAVADAYTIVILDGSDPLALVETNRQSAYFSDLAFDGATVLTLAVNPYGGYSQYSRFHVDSAGIISLLNSLNRRESGSLAAGGGILASFSGTSETVFRFLDPVDFSLRASFLVGGGTSAALSSQRWALISPTNGLACLDLAQADYMPSLVDFGEYSHLDYWVDEGPASTSYSYSGSAGGHYWLDKHRTHYSSTGGGSSDQLEFQVYDLQDPTNPVLVREDDLSVSWTSWEEYYTAGAQILDGHLLLETVSGCGWEAAPRVQITDLDTEVSYPPLFTHQFLGYEEGFLFTLYFQGSCDNSSLRAYRPQTDGTMPLVVDFGFDMTFLGCRGNQAILFDNPMDTIFIYDFSDPQNLVEVGSASYGGNIYAKAWHEDTLFFRDNSSVLHSLDITDPANPVVTSLFTTSDTAFSITFQAGYMVLGYADGLQLATVQPDGSVALVSPILSPPEPVTGFAIDGTHLYINTRFGLKLFDISDPANPTFIGQAEGCNSAVAAMGGHVVSGAMVWPMDCTVLPVADFQASTRTGEAPLAVEFTDLSGGMADSWLWDFGDGESSSDQNPTHLFAQAGTYSVTLTVTNLNGQDTAVKAGYITVSPEDVAPVEDLPDLPAAFSLAPNIPNPFNPRTTIGFSLPRDSHVLLQVVDVRGRVQDTLVDRTLSAGSHQVTWDGRNHPSGVYFYRLTADGFGQTRKMVMLK